MNLTTFWNFIAEFDQAYDFHRKKVMHKYGLSAIEVDLLLFIANNPALNTSADIVRLRKIAKSHVSMAVKSLSEKGYLHKCNDNKNRKIVHLYPTAAAEEIITFGRQEQLKFSKALSQGTTETEQERFYQHIEQVSQNLHKTYHLNEKKIIGGTT